MSTPITTLPIPTKQATKFDVGLDQVDNTSDANKPISALQAASIALKADASLLALYQPTATFRETMEDHLLSTFVPGANIAIDYNDALNTFTFSVSGVTISDGDKGDINVSGTGTVWNVENGAISLAKMANMATGSIIGRTTASTGVPEVLSFAALKTAMTFIKADVGLSNVDNTSDATKNTATATLTNKTLTAPVINSPTGLVKADVGLSNVDNTSDATKNAATATLTNKTLTTPVITSPTGLVKADVGLGNVDNISDANKPVSTAQSAALALKANAAAPSFTGVMTSVGASILTATAMGANAIDVTAGHNTKTISADATLTLSATPATNTLFTLELTNSDTNPHVITWPANFFSLAQQAIIATSTIPASGRLMIQMVYNGSVYLVAGEAASGDIAEVTVASATTTPIFAQASNNIAISGTTTITAFDTIAAGAIRVCRATGAFLLTHNATSLILPGGGNITTVAGDMFAVRSEGSGNARILWFAPTTVTGTGSAVRAVSPTFTGVPVIPTAAPGTNTTQAASTAFVTAAVAAGGGGGGARPDLFEPGSYANMPQIGAAGTNTLGGHSGNFTVLGTAAGVTTSLASMGFKRRNKITSAAATDSGAGVRSSTTGVAYAPNTSNSEVVRGEFIQGSADALTGCINAMGLGWFGGSSPNMATEPDTFTNCIMLAAKSTETQWVLRHNDGSGTTTDVVLNGGTGFPCNGNETDYIRLYFAFNGGATRTIDWTVKNLISGVSVTGQITTNMPDADQQLMSFNYRSTRANSTAAAINYGGNFGGFFVGAA